MSVLDALQALLHKMAPAASATNVVEALNKIGEAEGSQVAAAQDVADAIRRIADAYTPPTPPTPAFAGMYVLYVLAHPSWSPNPDEPAEGAGLDVEITLLRLAGNSLFVRRWSESAVEQPRDIDMETTIPPESVSSLRDLPVLVVAAMYGDDGTIVNSASSWPPSGQAPGGWQTPDTMWVEYQSTGLAKMRVGLGYDTDVERYNVAINARVNPPD